MSVLTIAATLNARAWDGTGHMLVAQVAYDRLTTRPRPHVSELAAKIQKDGVRTTPSTSPAGPTTSRRATRIRRFAGFFRPWHYIDIGCATADPDAVESSPLSKTNGNIVVALPYCVNLIKTKQFDALVPSESVAMALVIHFVGDIHQPLHTTGRYNPNPKPDDNTRTTPAATASASPISRTQWPPNLHTFWDEAYRRYYDERRCQSPAPPSPKPTRPRAPSRTERLDDPPRALRPRQSRPEI
jgi:hypothetical protein